MNTGNSIKSPAAFSAVGLLAGVLFGAGLVVGGMTTPDKVRGFLDFTGAWDPTLVFVMGGAVLVHTLAYWLIKGRASPVLADAFQIPTRKDVDAKLILGAAIFGLGWGVGGYCPGPAITNLPSGSLAVTAFVVTMLVSSWATGQIESRLGTHAARPATNPKPTHPEPTR